MPTSRETLLRQLIDYRLPIEPTLAGLAEYGWDSEAPLAWLEAEDVRAILRRYLSNTLTAEQVTDWADLIECREDIEPVLGQSQLQSMVFRLANPNLKGRVTPDLARKLLTKLNPAQGLGTE